MDPDPVWSDCDQIRIAGQPISHTCAQMLRRGAVLDAPQGQFTAISVGYAHACALRTDRTAACWGDNTDGQLEVPDGEYTAIDVAYYGRGCALRTDKTAACWGRDGAELAEAINNQGRFTAVSAGDENVCGVRTDDSAVCVYDSSDYVAELEGAYGKKGPFATVDTPDRAGCGLFVDGTAVC
ncbi:MAG: RCC1 domain-containing protein [Acidimicrobiaceae bacterium]|nr:RCC1 domain-containing protein [Acidimicrobiaceae bacterium]